MAPQGSRNPLVTTTTRRKHLFRSSPTPVKEKETHSFMKEGVCAPATKLIEVDDHHPSQYIPHALPHLFFANFIW
jgi:hypothetical protein